MDTAYGLPRERGLWTAGRRRKRPLGQICKCDVALHFFSRLFIVKSMPSDPRSIEIKDWPATTIVASCTQPQSYLPPFGSKKYSTGLHNILAQIEPCFSTDQSWYKYAEWGKCHHIISMLSQLQYISDIIQKWEAVWKMHHKVVTPE